MRVESQAPTGRYVGQRWLVGAIRLYRRRLSGRGPLGPVRCTFAHTESCSAYGLRAAEEATGLCQALRLIRARVRRCGRASLYRAPEGLVWGETYDEPDAEALARHLEDAHESAATCATVHRTAALVALRQGRHRDARAHAARAGDAPLTPVRDGMGYAALQRRRVGRRLMITAGAFGLVALGLWLAGAALWGLAQAPLWLCAALVSLRATHRRLRRYDQQRAAYAFASLGAPSKVRCPRQR